MMSPSVISCSQAADIRGKPFGTEWFDQSVSEKWPIMVSELVGHNIKVCLEVHFYIVDTRFDLLDLFFSRRNNSVVKTYKSSYT